MKKTILLGAILLLTACETGVKTEDDPFYVQKGLQNHPATTGLTQRDTPGNRQSTPLVKKEEVLFERDVLALKDSALSPGEALKSVGSNNSSRDSSPGASTQSSRNSSPNTSSNASPNISQRSSQNIEHFEGGQTTNGLTVNALRVGEHKIYTRLVFDIYKEKTSANKVGRYNVDYNFSKQTLTCTLNGYRNFLAKFPLFKKNHIIDKMYLESYGNESKFQVLIKLRDDASIKVYDYENPARLIIDVTPFR